MEETQAASGIIVRRAGREDAETLLGLIQALADYEQLEGPSEDAKRRLIEHGFGPSPRYEAHLVWKDGVAVGYAILFETYSTFLAQPTLYLEDLFVLPEARRFGAGRAIFQTLARLATERGCGRIEWVALDWNELAIGFYRKLGARHMDEWLHFRMTEPEFRAFADE
jgi:GNAT superfamily N-acetyltransferase